MSLPADLDVEQAILDYEEAQEAKKTRFKFFGRRLSDIPCFRESYLTGILSGLSLGLGHFLFTSRVRRSCDLAVFSFGAITAVSWFYCRYDRSKSAQDLLRFQHDLRQLQYVTGGKDVEEVEVDVTIEPKVTV